MTHYSGITELITFCRTLIIIIGICRRSSRQSVHSYNIVITSTPQFHPSFLHSHDVQLYQNNKSFTSIDNMIITHNINKSIPSDMPRTIPYPGPTLYQVQEHNLSFYLNFPSLWHKVNFIPHVVTHMHNAMISAIIIPFNLSFYFFVVFFPLSLNKTFCDLSSVVHFIAWNAVLENQHHQHFTASFDSLDRGNGDTQNLMAKQMILISFPLPLTKSNQR